MSSVSSNYSSVDDDIKTFMRKCKISTDIIVRWLGLGGPICVIRRIVYSGLRPEFIVATFAKEEFFLCKGTISSLAKEYL